MKTILDGITAKRYLIIMNISVLIVHICLIMIFSMIHVTPMVYVNIGSVICYCVCFFLVEKERVREYVMVTFTEIVIHTFMAVYYTGYGGSFQLYLLGCMAIVLFTHYFAVHIGIKPVNGPLLSFICCVLYVVSMIVSRSYSPPYPLSFNEQFYLRMFNVLLMFLLIFTFFSLLTLVASRNEIELANQANHDNLTGLVNRNYLTKYMHEIYETENLENYWLAILDIDDFKEINDRHGHLCGDYVLHAVAESIKDCCDEHIVCRWGGEEFMIIGTDPSRMETLLENIRSVISDKEFVYNDSIKLQLTVTIGAAHYNNNQSLDTWVNLADTRLYTGKQSGKNQVVNADTM